ncbi:transporter substrate-binding domain-containing protein [Paraburkholderia sp. J8-2]|uniref:transporter substrate-binding domain-containing protein n=1 Tax=Paraburkholderia sp. J8-2 TaxID=2805440 RepID=UPI002AB71A7D|nr:transporter substrate-binding domain-containing protein [Paraburkholderia sp. J8-2]
MLSRWCAALLMMITAVATAVAQPASVPVRVATLVLPPFVMEQGGALSGFSIDLWNAVAAKLDVSCSYQMTPDVKGVFDALRSAKADVAVSGLFYSIERDREFDFSYPIMEAGLRIMVRGTGQSSTPQPLRDLMNLLFSRVTLYWVGAAALIALIAARLMWFVQRHLRDDAAGSSQKYFPAIFRMMYWAATTLLTQADDAPPPHWAARALAVLWMFVGIVFVALYTAQLTTTLTVEQIQGAIKGPKDLPGKRVATLKGGSAVGYLRQHEVDVQEFDDLSHVYQALQNRDVDAVVLGAAGLDDYAAHEGKGLVRMVGLEFNKNDVGFVFPMGSRIRRRVDSALVALREDGTYQQIYDKWFGTQ